MAESIDKKAMINDGKNIELDGVTVINEGISLAEAKKEEPKVETTPVASDETVIPENAVATEVPTDEPVFSPIDTLVAPVDLPMGDPAVSTELPISLLSDKKLEDYNQTDISANLSRPSFVGVANVGTRDFDSSFETKTDKRIFKTKEDVEKAKQEFMKAMSDLFDTYLRGPIENCIDVKDMVFAWGSDVVHNGMKMDNFLQYSRMENVYNGMDNSEYTDIEKTPDSSNGMNY